VRARRRLKSRRQDEIPTPLGPATVNAGSTVDASDEWADAASPAPGESWGWAISIRPANNQICYFMRSPVGLKPEEETGQMNVSLTPELEQLVTDKVKSGMYQTSSEVIREGLRLLRERDERLQSLRRDIRAGFEAVDRGEFTEYGRASVQGLADRVKSRGRKRLGDEERITGAR
jgi:antitoxin ParD1/3/4